MNQEQFRTYLQEEYLRLRGANPAYSLRAYARRLQVDPGSLSQFLNGHRTYSLKRIQQIALHIGMDRDQIAGFLGSRNGLSFIELDRFELLRHWHYAAILECLELNDFEPSSKWIAERLGISTSVVKVAVNRLFTEGVLSRNEDGSWRNNWSEYSTQTHENVDELALRNHQKQLLKLAAQSIEHNDPPLKSHTAYVSAIDSDLVPEIKSEIQKFRGKIAKLIKAKSKKKDAIYCLQVNLFPEMSLTKGEDHV